MLVICDVNILKFMVPTICARLYQMEYALDVEVIMPLWIRRNFFSRGFINIYPNRKYHPVTSFFMWFFDSPYYIDDSTRNYILELVTVGGEDR